MGPTTYPASAAVPAPATHPAEAAAASTAHPADAAPAACSAEAGCSSRPSSGTKQQQQQQQQQQAGVSGQEGSSSGCEHLARQEPVGLVESYSRAPSTAAASFSSQAPDHDHKPHVAVSIGVTAEEAAPHDPEQLLVSIGRMQELDIIAGNELAAALSLPAHLFDPEAGPAASSAESCWICMCGAEDGELTQPCACPSMYSHPICLVRWQMRQHGRDDELMCRFCKGPLPPWADTLLDIRNKRAAALTATNKRSTYYALACVITMVCIIVLTVTFSFLKYSRKI